MTKISSASSISKDIPGTVFNTPLTQPFQFNGDADGSVGQEINQFQGSVVFSVPVVSLEGRSGLNLELALSYSSNVSPDVSRSNLYAPTSPLGLGWDLLVDCIEADYAAPDNRDSAAFFLTSHGVRNRLYRDDRLWKRAALPASAAASLNAGVLDGAIVSAFLAQTLAVDASSSVTVVEPSASWSIDDAVNEFSLLVKTSATDSTVLDVFDGGLGYEPESFDFSRVRYYARYGRWEVWSSAGLCSVFGGGVQPLPDGNHASRGQSVVWGVCWNNWTGASTVAHDSAGALLQHQYPQRWMISSQRALNRDEITYAYDQVTQRVGEEGLLYTKAIYLSVVTDMLGRTATLSYADKRFSTALDEPREYLDPCKPVPDSTPDAYQSRYETRYLQTVVVKTAAQEILSSSTFGYALKLYCPVPGNAPPGYGGDRYKRVLTSIEKVNGVGFGLPSMTFTYHGLQDINPGALASKTLPEGALVLYSYQQKSLASCSRSLTITPALASATPRIWFGPDYAVIVWLALDRFSVAVYTWSGRWIAWQPVVREYLFSADPDGIEAALEDDLFVLGLRAANQTGSAFVYFHKDNRILGGWLDAPALPLQLPGADFQLATGSCFFALSNGSDNSIRRYVWDSALNNWRGSAGPVPAEARDPTRFPVFLAASANVLCTLFYDRYGQPGRKQSVQQLAYLDESGVWQEGDSRIAAELLVAGTTVPDIRNNLQWSAAPWVCAATAVTQDSGSAVNYQISLYTWGHGGSAYRWDAPSQPFAQGCSVSRAPGGELAYPVASRITASGMVASGPYLLRYNGRQWLPNDNLALRLPVTDDTLFWFAVGEDIVLKTENSVSEILGEAQVYDPGSGQGAWSAAPLPLYDGPPATPRLNSYFPTASDDFISFDRNVYYRGTSTDWVEPIQRPIPALPPGANTATLINEAPGFMAYLQEDQGDPLQTQVLLLDSGCIGATEVVMQSFFRAIDADGHLVEQIDGQLPDGPGSFATFLPLDAPFSQAQSITLHRYLNGSIVSPVTDYPVQAVTVNDGYRSKVYHYDFDAATAAVNPQGYSCKYYHSSVQIADGSVSGHTAFTFINGVGGQQPGNPVLSAVLDGKLALKELFDAASRLVASQQNQWTPVYAATDPQTGEQMTLRGALVQLQQTTNATDNVPGTQTFRYDAASGQLVSTSTQVLGALNVLETHTKWVEPAYKAYPGLTCTNQLAQQAGSGYDVAAEGSGPVTSAQQSVAMRGYPGPFVTGAGTLELMLPSQSYARRQPGQSSPAVAPQQWLLQSQVLRTNALGATTEITNAAGLVTSTLFSADGAMLVGTFAGASLAGQEAYYYGFEPYESAGVWALDNAVTPVVDGICCTGTRSLCVPSNTVGAPLMLAPADRGEAFLFSFWGTLDPAADDPQPVAAWRIEFVCADGSTPPSPIVLSVDTTDWRYGCARVDLGGASSPVTMSITPQNAGSCNVYLDNVCVSRLHGSSRVAVYDPVSRLLTADVGPYGQIRRHVLDFEQREIATTSEFDAVVSVVAPFLSRQDSAAFDPARPNSQLVLQPMGVTAYERFRNNGVLGPGFETARPADWRSERGQLNYLGGAGGGIRFVKPDPGGNYALRFDVASSGVAFPSLGVSVGDALLVRWDATDQRWTLDDPNNGVSLHASTPDPVGAWTLVLGTRAVIFLVNGEVVFDYVPQQMPSGLPGIAPDGPLSISGFIVGASPQIGMKYFDAGSKPQQGVSIEGQQAVVSMPLYDAAARPVIQVKPVAYEAPAGSSDALLGLRVDLVTAFDWKTGVLCGQAALAYPLDEGYPYVRQQFEASPLGRLLQTGMPGKTFAITGSPDDHTARQLYGSNGNAVVNAALGLQAGRYASVTSTDQDGRVSLALKDTLGRAIATATRLDGNGEFWQYNLEFTRYDAAGQTHVVRVPNYYAPPEGSAAEAWVNVSRRDLLGQLTSTTTPDVSLIRKVADCTGRTRFTQNPAVAALGLILYAKYDRYGRTLEGGIVPGVWDAERLIGLANQPDWPGAADGARPVRQYRYGDDPAAVNDLGLLVRTLNFDEGSSAPTTENLQSYDAAGRIASYVTLVAQDESRYTIGYRYDNLGNVAGTVYDSGYTVYNDRDEVGRVSQLRDGSGMILATYAYHPDDQTASQIVLPDTPAQQRIVYGYAPPGWLQSIESRCMTETLGYTTGGCDGEVCYSGRLCAAGTAFGNFAGSPGSFPAEVDYAYAYDARGQLIVAEAQTGGQLVADWSLGLSTPTQFDMNGNFLQVQDGAAEQRYVYKTSTNQVRNTMGGTGTDYESNANGAVTRAAPAGIERIDYQPLTGQASSIETVSAGTITLLYDSSSNRVRKTVGDLCLTYVRGVSGWPLGECLRNGSTALQETEYVYGPRGICAIRIDGVLHVVLTDHLNSVRGVAGPEGTLLLAFHYNAFGQAVVEFGDADLLRYRFTGYEFDAETGLYNASARLYDPRLKRFYSVDPQMQFYSPYLYGGNNPISVIDPTGEAAWWAVLVGAVVGIVAAVATGGALAPVVAGLEGSAAVAASAGVAATAGALGSVAGDATTAGLAGEHFTATRALVDVVGGAAGGAVGAVAGGAAAQVAMKSALALSAGISAKAVTTIGTVTAGVVGGTAGAAAQSGVTSAMTGQSAFSVGSAVNMLVGAVAGFGGALLGSGAHLGWSGDTMPVWVGQKDLPTMNTVPRHNVVERFLTLNPEDIGGYSNSIYQLNAQNAATHDVIDVHGSPGTVFATFYDGSGKWYHRPMSTRLFAEYIRSRPGWTDPGRPPVKLSVCNGGRGGLFTESAGQSLATALGRTVVAARGTVNMGTGAPAGRRQTFT